MTVPALLHLLPTEQVALRTYSNRIRERFSDRILGMMLFGSKARGEAGAESDLDLLVLVDVETPNFRSELWQIASDISLDYNLVLSPRVVGQARWNEMRRMRLPLYRAIVADGIVLIPEPLPT
jgi:predicted nucleotidyltransferase